MVRRLTLAVALALVFVWAFGVSAPRAAQQAPAPGGAAPPDGPIKLARHPDYHAGRIAFSYMGDIWVANEDGTRPERLTINTARETMPRFSPDGRWIAFSSNRFGGNDVFVMPATGGAPRQLTFFSGNDDVVGWSRDGQQVLFRSAHGEGAFPNVATLYQVPVAGGPERALPVDWGAYGDFSPDGRQLVFNRHPGSGFRKHFRGSPSADIWIADLNAKTYRQLLADDRYNRMWPMWGADNQIYFVGDPMPNEKNVKAGSLEVFKSTNNIYRIPASGSGQPVQVTKHTSGSLFFPAMSPDGKVIVYEEGFGIWKLDVGSGRTSEIRIQIDTDDKENQFEVVALQSEVDGFDISPSAQRAVISARGQLLTIATNRGDVTRIAPDPMASRNQSPRWSPDGKWIAFISDKAGSDEIWITDPEGRSPKQISKLDNEKGQVQWSPDSRLLLFTAADKRLYSYSVADTKTGVISTDTVGRIGAFAISPDSKWVALTKQDRTLRSHVYIVPIGGGEERHIADDRLLYSENNPAWTADGRHLVFTSSEGASNGIASQGGIQTTTELYALPLRDQDRDPLNRDIDNEAQALAAQAAGRAGGAAAGQAPTVQIDWGGLPRRARQIPVPGNSISGLVASPDGRSVAFNLSTTGGAGRGTEVEGTAGIYIVNVDTNALTRVPSVTGGGGGGGGRGGGGGGAAAGANKEFSRDGRTLYFRSGQSLYASAIPAGGGGGGAAAPAAGGGGGGRGGRGGGGAGGGAAAPANESGAPRQITFTASIEVDKRKLRQQVFNEGWRIMKNRFYDAEMHTVNWGAMRTKYEPLLDYLVDQSELQAVMMMMIGELNASHTGVSGGPSDSGPSTGATRYPGFDFTFDNSGYYRVGHIYKTGPADHDYLKVREGDYIIALDGRDLKTTDNYWKQLTFLSSNKLRFLLNDKPSHDGAWEVAITPANNFGDLQYQRWVEDRRQMVDKLSNGEFGYLHIRAMDAPSLRQFVLDLAANRTKKGLVIDQRFNGGGGIEQELLSILSGREYQYTVGRDAGVRQPRPQAFYGAMVVMQNERSGSNAEMFPAGFRALGLGKVIGVPTAAAVIGTGSYTLLDGSTIRTPGTGVWLATGENMENYGVPPDVYVDNTPDTHLQKRDAQIEKAVETLREELKKKPVR